MTEEESMEAVVPEEDVLVPLIVAEFVARGVAGDVSKTVSSASRSFSWFRPIELKFGGSPSSSQIYLEILGCVTKLTQTQWLQRPLSWSRRRRAMFLKSTRRMEL